MQRFLFHLKKSDENGATAIEYGLVAVFISSAIICGLIVTAIAVLTVTAAMAVV